MSSSLISVGSVGASVAAGNGAPGAGKSAPKTLMDVFAGLLGKASVGAEAGVEVAQESSTTINGVELRGGVRELLATLLGLQAPEAEETGEAPPAEGGDEAGEGADLSGLADLLLEIEAALDAGETVDPSLLEKLGVSADALAAIIGGPVTTDVTASVASPLAIEAGAAAKVAPPGDQPADPIHPMLQGLADKLKELGEKLGDANGELAQKLAALAEKLGTMRTTIAELLEAVPELRTTIGELMQLKGEAKVGAQVTPLATPELKLPDNPSLSAKKADAPASAPANDAVDAPPETEVADAPKPQSKVEAKTDVKPDQPILANAPEKREAPAASPPAQSMPAADTSVATAATAIAAVGSTATIHGDVRAIHTAYQQPAPINLPHVAFEIVRQVQQGVSKFQIRLDPPELGRVDVNLDMDRSGQVNARLTVERSETLDLLQRDQRALERALAQAGLDTSKTNLEFSLRQNPFAGQDGKRQGQPGSSPFASDVRTPLLAEAEPPAVTIYRGTASPGGVNIFV